MTPDQWLSKARHPAVALICSAFLAPVVIAGTLPRSLALQLSQMNAQAGRLNSYLGKDPARWRAGLSASASSLTFSTFLGGSNFDEIFALAVDTGGNIYVTGQTASANFPTRAGGQDGNRDIFIAKLNPDGTHFAYVTFLGGHENETPRGLAIDGLGNVYVTGYTISTDFPTTTGAYKTSSSGNEDAFVVKLNSSGTLVYSTYLGGAGRDFATAIAIDSLGNTYVTGYTSSTNFPTVSSAFQPFYGGGYNDAFVTKLNASGSGLVYSTYLGGIGNDAAFGITVDSLGNAYVCGETESINFPIFAALQSQHSGEHDAFVAKLNVLASGLYFSTYLGGSLEDSATSIALDSFQNVYVAGSTASWDFPVSSTAFQRTMGGGPFDAFVTKLNSAGTALVFSTLLGGSGSDQANALAVDSAGNAWIAGSTGSPNFPLVNALQSQLAGSNDAFVATLNATGDQLLYSSYLGGGMEESALAIGIDSRGSEVVAGFTDSAGFPVTAGIVQQIFGGSFDGFVSKLATGVCPYTVSPSLLNVGAAGGSGTITVTAANGCSLPTASSNVAWASVSVVGSLVNWTVTSNPGSSARQGTFNVGGQTVSIDQAGAPCTYTLSVSSLNVAAIGGSGIIFITPGYPDCAPATSSSSVPWASISVSGTAASWAVNGNLSSQARSGNFNIGGRIVSISQSGEACSYALTANSISVTAVGGAGSIGITPTPGDCPPATATSNVSWASVSVSGNTAPWSISSNTGSESRAGHFTIAGQDVAINQSASAGAPGTLTLNRAVLNFGVSGSLITSPQTVIVGFTGGSGVAWTVSSNQPNISVSPPGGTGKGSFSVTAAAGASGTVTVSAPGAASSPRQVQVSVSNVTPGTPAGSFDTPVSSANAVAGAIPVTGWALDNIEVTKVDIWREPTSAEPAGLAYIGDAVFVSDARPDVEGRSPGSPFNYRAGWGYMLLTNFLPNNGGPPGPGNGTFALHAIAHNKAGKSFDMGTRVIVVDNAHATKPFGTIDTPGQGAIVSGASYVNFGWALTQNPYQIPIDGSTIGVYVDGAPVGHPYYNQYRADIANFFPGLANSNGAIGFFYIDTTALENGVHTIAWVVYDDHARGDGIGSRYFTVLNGSGIAISDQQPVVLPSGPGNDLDLQIEELARVEEKLGASQGFMMVHGQRRPLPIGSSLKAGVFYWQPGPGFLGEYSLVFERSGRPDLNVRVTIRPKQYR